MATDKTLDIIQLDDPTPRWASIATLIAGLVILAILIAPFALDDNSDAESSSSVTTQSAGTGSNNELCRPSVDLPSFAKPAGSVVLPSWMKICDWFNEPIVPSGG